VLLGVKSTRTVLIRHTVVAVIAALLVFGVWQANSFWSPDMRLWKAFGGASIILLWGALMIGPAARLWRPLNRFVSWRREYGIWFAIISFVHGYLVWDGWARWDVAGLLGFQYSAEAEMFLRVEPGFGLANLMGIVAVLLGLVLAATSFDRVVSFFGISSWKWLHTLAYAIYYLVSLHVLYFAFLHYVPSALRMTEYPDNPLRYLYLALILSITIIQAAAFIKTVWYKRTFGRD